MKRRSFLKNSGLVAAGAIAVPYILPSGRLFAATGSRKVDHVIYVMYAGGVRNQEAPLQQYLANQGLPTEGNIMPNIFKGGQPTSNLIYNQWSPILSKPIQEDAAFFPELRYAQGPTGHYNGHTVSVTGKYSNLSTNLNVNPESPTIFEFYRKHSSPSKSALNAWWLSEGLGPYPSLNYSQDPAYGPQYGANYLRPASLITGLGNQYFGNLINPQPDDVDNVAQVKSFLDSNFSLGAAQSGFRNELEDQEKVGEFLKRLANQPETIDFPTLDGSTNGLTGDLLNVAAAWQVMKEFSPELLVLNTFNLDICHSDFSRYCQLMHLSDFGVGWLWNKIQGPEGAALGLKDNTILVLCPEHGRNLEPNTLRDDNGLAAYDHTSDDNSRRTFAMLAGPKSIIKQNTVFGSEASPEGESVDIVPTIADALGFYDDIPKQYLDGSPLRQAFN